MTQRGWWGSTIVSADATGDVRPGLGALYKAIAADGGIAQSGSEALGIIQFPANSGEHVSYGYQGEMKYVAAAAIAAGAQLTVAVSGYFTTATSGTWAIGRNAEIAVGSGAVGRGFFDFTVPVYRTTAG